SHSIGRLCLDSSQGGLSTALDLRIILLRHDLVVYLALILRNQPDPGRSELMRFVSKVCRSLISLGLVFGLAFVTSGCDASGGQKTEYKPIESNILKKLGTSGPSQSQAEREAHLPARAKKKP